MAATAVSTVLSKFGELAVSEGRLLVEVGDKMMLMRDRLEWLQAFIRDADRKRRIGTDGLSRVWLRQTRDVAFQVEDALDEFFRKVDLESQGYYGWQKWSRYLTGCWTQISVRHVLSERLDKIGRRLEQISDNQKDYNIEHTPLVTLSSSTATAAAWRDERNDMLGFGKDIETLEKMLLRKDHPKTMFISIIGESGVGKRTLAKEVYAIPVDESVRQIIFFGFMEPDSWPEEVVQLIYGFCLNDMEDSEKLGEVADPVPRVAEEGVHAAVTPVAPKKDIDQAAKLREYLSDKRYLVILGGVTSIAMLNLLKNCLPDDNNNGSSVVLVLDAENEEVALHANTMNEDGVNGIHLVTRLDEKTSGELFRSKALRKEEVSDDADADTNANANANARKKNKYDEIVFAITGGHRLSLVLLAGLVRFKEEPLQWDVVLQQLMPGQPETKLSTSTSMEKIFWASFEDLPNDVKSCFLYMVVAGKGMVLKGGDTVKMWIAEGFIKPHKGKTMEEVGDAYMKELVLRCLLEVHSRDDLGGIEGVRVHPSLHGFLLSEAREAGFMEIHDIHHTFVPPSARRLSFDIYGGRYSRLTNKLPKLRSFISLRNGDLDSSEITDSTGAEKELFDLQFLLGSKFLRLLSIEGHRVKEFPKDIGRLLELRYICVGSKELKELPSSIKRLVKLQTLDIRDTAVDMIDPGFWKITTLRHVFSSGCLVLPESLEQELPELQTLDGLKPPQGRTWEAHSCPLRWMSKLRTLGLEGIQREDHRTALGAALQGMHLLVSVTLVGDGLPHCVFTEPNLRLLQKIWLEGSVDWPTGPLNVRQRRPNLRIVQVEPVADVPPHIADELSASALLL